MWNDLKSAALTHACIRLFYAGLAAMCIGAPFLLPKLYADPADVHNLFAALYLAAPACLAALICLDRLLQQIKKGAVFSRQNVKSLRILSWCCFYVAAECVAFAFLYGPFVMIAAAALFTGLVVRVVKNILAAAVQIKQENDFTI